MEELKDNLLLQHGARLLSTCQSIALIHSLIQSSSEQGYMVWGCSTENANLTKQRYVQKVLDSTQE